MISTIIKRMNIPTHYKYGLISIGTINLTSYWIIDDMQKNDSTL